MLDAGDDFECKFSSDRFAEFQEIIQRPRAPARAGSFKCTPGGPRKVVRPYSAPSPPPPKPPPPLAHLKAPPLPYWPIHQSG